MQVYVQNTPEISYYKYFLKKHKIIAIYYIKDNFNPLSEENNINHNQKLPKKKNCKKKLRYSVFDIISKLAFELRSFDFCAI